MTKKIAEPLQDQQFERVMTDDEAQLAAELQQTREAFFAALAKYRGLLEDTTLVGNRSKQQKDEQARTFQDLNSLNGQLDQLNVGEGLLALVFTSLNSVLSLRDKMNELRFQNTMLWKELNKLKAEAVKPEQK